MKTRMFNYRIFLSPSRVWWGLMAIVVLSLLIAITSRNHKFVQLFDINQGLRIEQGGNSHTQNQLESRHVVFIKVHKAASTTVMNVFLRFAVSRNLTVMLPKNGNVINEDYTVRKADILPSASETGKYDILCNHVIHNKTAIGQYFPQDTKYIAILREPFEQFVSAFMYYRHVYPAKYLTKIPSDQPLFEYLKNPEKYEPRITTDSFTRSRQSIDLGFAGNDSNNENLIDQFVKNVSLEFDLVLISEYFDESMVLLKRTLNWKLSDVLYITSNAFSKHKQSLNVTTNDRQKHRQWAKADYALYQYFYDLFWQKIHNEGPDFHKEVRTLRFLRKAFSDFCFLKGQKNMEATFSATEFNDAIKIHRSSCNYFMTPETVLVDLLKKKYLLKNRKRFESYSRAKPSIKKKS